MFWAPHWETDGSSPNGNEVTGSQKIASYLDGQRGMMAECASVESLEGVQSGWLAPAAASSSGQFQTCKNNGSGACAATAATYGMQKNTGGTLASDPTGVLFNCTDPTRNNGDDCAYYAFPGDPFAQVAEYRWDASAYSVGSHVADFKPASASVYRPGVLPLISGVTNLNKSLLTDATTARPMVSGDFATRSYKDNNSSKSNILYLGNHDLSSSVAGTKVVLQTLLQLGEVAPPPVTTEVSRSSPVVAMIDGDPAMVQGTFESIVPPPTTPAVYFDTDAAGFRTPYQAGHMRAVDLANVSTTATAYTNTSPIFDAASGIPATRNIFTNTGTGGRTTVAQRNFDAANAGALVGAGLTAASQSTIITKVRAGGLAGVDRFTHTAQRRSRIASSA